MAAPGGPAAVVEERLDLWIGGEAVPSATGGRADTVDPSTEQPIASVACAGPDDVDRAVAAARSAMSGAWSQVTPRERAQLLYDLSAAIEAHEDELAMAETLDSGKPLARARREVRSTVRYFRYYAGAADKLHGEEIPLGPDYVDFTMREPMGVTAHIVPWNMPLNMVGRSVAPALAAGNTVVVKPALETPLTALRLGPLFEEVGFPAGVYNAVPGPGREAGGALVRHPDVDLVTFTGSVETGKDVMRGAAEHVTPVVLELGGKSPSVVLADADLDLAASEAARGIFSNSGQFCNASSRLVVDRRVRDDVVERLVEHARSLRLGAGVDDPDLGPLVSDVHHRRVLGHLDAAQVAGAAVAAGGGRPGGLDRGYFVEPTVLTGLSPDDTVAQEEIFGPVVAVIDFEDEREAASIANNSRYGLAAGIFTRDIDRALRLAREIQAGQVYVNEYFAGGEETPFGGFKDSGFGREKGLEGLRSYTQTKNVAIRLRRP
jgi:aldehyde dehydrogenase (NAD+)